MDSELQAAQSRCRAADERAAALGVASVEGRVVSEEVMRWLDHRNSGEEGEETEAEEEEEEAGEAEMMVMENGESARAGEDEERIRGPTAMERRWCAEQAGDSASSELRLLDGLSSRLQAGGLLLESWRRERQEIERTHGSVASLRALLSTSTDIGGAPTPTTKTTADSTADSKSSGKERPAAASEGEPPRGRLQQLEALQEKAATVSESIERLSVGIDAMRGRGEAPRPQTPTTRRPTRSHTTPIPPNTRSLFGSA